MDLKQVFEEMGYEAVRQLPDGRWIGVFSFLQTYGLCVGLTEMDYAYRYCYSNRFAVHRAAQDWTGDGDPPGLWIKLKGHPTRGEVVGPGLTAL